MQLLQMLDNDSRGINLAVSNNINDLAYKCAHELPTNNPDIEAVVHALIDIVLMHNYIYLARSYLWYTFLRVIGFFIILYAYLPSRYYHIFILQYRLILYV